MKNRLFRSRLAGALERFLAFKRALGIKYESQVFILRSFDRFVARQAPRRGRLPLARLLRDWLGCKEGRKPRTIAVHLSLVREFFRYLGRSDPSVFVPGRDWGPWETGSRFVPRILSQSEVRALLRATKGLAGPRWRSWTFHMLILVLYCTGLRFGEPLRLTVDDVDLEQRVLRVRESKYSAEDLELGRRPQVRLRGKGNRERVCPLWRETGAALSRLLERQPAPPGASIFRNARGATLSRDGAAYIIEKHVRGSSESTPALGRLRVTPHVFRHSCAVALLQSGVDLVVIRDYLGHASVSTTSRYVSSNLRLRRSALEAFWKRAGIETARPDKWRPTPDILRFLESL